MLNRYIFYKQHIVILWFFCLPIILLSADSKDKKTLEVYISTTGQDKNKGLSPKSEIYSMKKAESIVRSKLWKKHRNVIIHIDSGIYTRQHTRWKFSMEDKNITFLGNKTNKPIFDGEGINATWLRVDYSSHHTKTNIHIKNIQIQNYARAIFLHGSKKDKRKKADYNSITNCTFKNIGDKHSSAKVGYAAISVMNSSFNLFENNKFINIENNKTMCRTKKNKKKCFNTNTLIHAFYFAYYSSFNNIKKNIFENISGDAIKTRASSSFNIIEDNRFNKIRRVHQDWYAHYANVANEDIIECKSWGNTFFNNFVGQAYNTKKKASMSDLKTKFYKLSGQAEYCNKQKVNTNIDSKIPRVYEKGLR